MEVEGVLVEVRKVADRRQVPLEGQAEVAGGDGGGGAGSVASGSGRCRCRRRCDGVLGRGQRGVARRHLVPHALHLDQGAASGDVAFAAEPRGDGLRQRQQRRGAAPVDGGRGPEESRRRLGARVPVPALRRRGVQSVGGRGGGRPGSGQDPGAGERDVGKIVLRRLSRLPQGGGRLVQRRERRRRVPEPAVGVLGAEERDPELQERAILPRGRGGGSVSRGLRRRLVVVGFGGAPVAVCCCRSYCCPAPSSRRLLSERRRELARRVQSLLVSLKQLPESLCLFRVGVKRFQVGEERRSAFGDQLACDSVGGDEEVLPALKVEDGRRHHRRPRVRLPDLAVEGAQVLDLVGRVGAFADLGQPRGPADAVVAPRVVRVLVEEEPPGPVGLGGARRPQGLEAAGAELAGAPVSFFFFRVGKRGSREQRKRASVFVFEFFFSFFDGALGGLDPSGEKKGGRGEGGGVKRTSSRERGARPRCWAWPQRSPRPPTA